MTDLAIELSRDQEDMRAREAGPPDPEKKDILLSNVKKGMQMNDINTNLDLTFNMDKVVDESRNLATTTLSGDGGKRIGLASADCSPLSSMNYLISPTALRENKKMPNTRHSSKE